MKMEIGRNTVQINLRTKEKTATKLRELCVERKISRTVLINAIIENYFDELNSKVAQ